MGKNTLLNLIKQQNDDDHNIFGEMFWIYIDNVERRNKKYQGNSYISSKTNLLNKGVSKIIENETK